MGHYASKQLLRIAIVMQEEELEEKRKTIATLQEELICLALADGLLRLQLRLAGIEPKI